MHPEQLRGNLDLILLTVLEREPLYGFAIIQAARERSGGYFDFREGSLYPALHRLEAAGWLATELREAGRNGQPRKYYAITQVGRAELETKRQEFRAFTRAVADLHGA